MKDHNGEILVASINGLVIKEGVFGEDLRSNTDDSGVFKIDGTTNKMVEDFPKPTVDIGTYSATVKLQYLGDDNYKIPDQKFDVSFNLTTSTGEPYAGQFGDYSFTNGKFVTKLKDGESKSFTGIPKDAKLTVTVSDPDNSNTYYSYIITDKVGEDNPVVISEASNARKGTVSIQEDHPDILITVTDTRHLLTVTNHTQKNVEDESDYSDKTKKFPVKLTLLDETGNPVTTEDDDGTILIDKSGELVTFDKNGEYTAKLADNESLILFVPEGYQVKVGDYEKFNYTTSLKVDGTDLPTGTEETTVSFVKIGSENVTDHSVDIYHTVNSVVISGIQDAAHKVWPFILGGAIIASAAGYVYLKKKKET